MIQKSKILFYLLASKQTSLGASTIYCRLVLNNQRKQFSTGISISIKEWDKVKQRVKGKNPEAESINICLSQIRNKLAEAE